ncbi:MAG: hypothetical protein LRZ98_02140 [Candidatus Pacebacteria bacterium]|nr:hypothetical protein [Candidatus Paceibacterota bacterium]
MDILVGAMIVTRSSVDDLSATTTSFKTTLHNSTDDFYKNAVLTFTSGELYGQSRRISNYDGKYKKITLDPALTSAPNNIDRFTIITQNVRMEEQIIDHEKLELIERIKQKDERIKQKDERIKQEDFRKDIKKDNKLVLNKIDSISTNINHIKTTNIDNKIQTETMIPILNHISSDLKQVLTNIDAINFSDNQTLLRLLDISEVSSTEVNNIKNKLADLQAVSSVTRKIVEQSVIEPIIET